MSIAENISVYKSWLSPDFASYAFKALLEEIEWQDTVTLESTGKPNKLSRKMAYATNEGTEYLYNGLRLKGTGWHSTLLVIKDRLSAFLGVPFNSVLLNLYSSGKDEIRWHADKEEQLGEYPIIACVNLGHWRTFHFLEKATSIKEGIKVENGDLLVMWEKCQKKCLHAILKEQLIEGPRISLTYRQLV